MHPNDYADWLKQVDPDPTKGFSADTELETAATAIAAARQRGDTATEQTLIAKIHASEQRTDYTPQELGLSPSVTDEVNKAGRSFNMALEKLRTRFGIPATPAQAAPMGTAPPL